MTPAQNTQAYIQGFEDGERATKVKMLREREWVELTDEQIEDCYKQGGIGRAIQLFKEKNT